MECPHCNNQVQIPDDTLISAQTYQKIVTSVTKCCGKLVHVYPLFKYKVYPYKGDRNEDDWGRKST